MASIQDRQDSILSKDVSTTESSRRTSTASAHHVLKGEKDVSSIFVCEPGNNESDVLASQPPYHVFGAGMKMFVVCIVSAVAALSGLATYMYFPAQTALEKDLDIPRELVNLSITTYILAQGIGPSFWGPLADHQGRRITLIYTLALFVGANAALAVSTNGTMLMVFRALQALGSASTISLGAGVIADISPPSERGGYIGWFSGVRQLSLGLGPVVGGVLAEYLGWRAIFWFLVGFSTLSILLIVLLLPETLRRIAGNGSTPLSSWIYRPVLWSFLRGGRHNTDEEATIDASRAELKASKPLTASVFFGPLRMLLEKDVFCALLFGSCVYTSWSMMVASTAYLFEDHYGFHTLQIGFCFLANGLGCVLGSILAGRSLNSDFNREARLWQHERGIPVSTPILSKPIPTTFALERARLSRGPLYCFIMIFSTLVFGWTLTSVDESLGPSNTHWIAPLLAQFACGWSATSVLTSNNSLVVDLYPDKSASASAVLNLSRSLMAAGGIAAVEPLLSTFGAGYMSVILAGLLLLGLIPYVLHARWGPAWREAREKRLQSPRV